MAYRGSFSLRSTKDTSSKARPLFRVVVFALLLVYFTSSDLIPPTTCGGTRQRSSGIIQFPTSGKITGENTLCEWTIVVPRGLRIELVFTDFVMKTTCCSCTYDYLEIRDGQDENSTLIDDRYCASSKPKLVYSTGNVLWLRFVSNFRTFRGNRFRLSYNSVCGAHFTNITGTFTSPNYPRQYDDNLDCIYTIVVPRGRLKVIFEQFDLEGKMPSCLYDTLEVKEIRSVQKQSNSHPSTRRYCGSEKLPIVYSMKGGHLWFRLKTDLSGTGLFFARYRTISVGEGNCGGFLRAPSGLIYSHNYPFQFPANEECIWKIQVPHGKHIHLYFDTMEFSQNGDMDCQYASVTIYDDLDKASLIGQYCGTTLPGVIISRTNALTIHAQSSGIHSPGWFSLRYSSSGTGLCGTDPKFTCKNRLCIEGRLKCDGRDDCLDSSDEEDCLEKTQPLTWYSFWPVAIVLVIVLLGVWLWRTWRMCKSVRSNVESNTYICSSSCQHQNPRTSDIIEPPTYDEATAQRSAPPPSYEEAVQSQHLPPAAGAAADISTTGLETTETSENTIPKDSDVCGGQGHTLTLQQRNGECRAEFHASTDPQGEPYENHRPRSDIAID